MIAQLAENNCSKLLTSSVAVQASSMLTTFLQHFVSAAERAILLRFAGWDMSLFRLASSSSLSGLPSVGKD
jgi:hypothetical protein